MGQLIVGQDAGMPPTLAAAHPYLSLNLAEWQLRDYRLPGNPATDTYIVPCSGGADSTVLAIELKRRFPAVRFKYVFTDTGAEDVEIYTALQRLEAYLGIIIDRVKPQRDLWELIEAWDFLPGHNSRWCTRELKAVSFSHWLGQNRGQGGNWMFIGIRADEAFRLAFSIDGVESVFPFIEMGADRAGVFKVLSDSVGIPSFYRRRTRSGCGPCPFQRRSEVVGLLQEQPVEFHRGMRVEKVAKTDLARHQAAPDLGAEVGLTRNWLTIPMPPQGATKISGSPRRGQRKGQSSLFGDNGVFIAAEYFVDSFLGIEEIVWHRRLVSFSPTLAGIKGQIQDRYAHLLATAETWDLTPQAMREEARFAIFYIEAPGTHFDPSGPQAGGYTWAQGVSFAQIEHVMSWAQRILCADHLRIEAASLEDHHPLTWAYESAQGAVKCLARVGEPTGAIVQSAWYEPSEPTPEESLDERFVTCPACSV